jgi:hypothetical protein
VRGSLFAVAGIDSSKGIAIQIPTASIVSKADVVIQRIRGKEIFERDRLQEEERERERREKEEAARKARAEAAERGRLASREWAERRRVKSNVTKHDNEQRRGRQLGRRQSIPDLATGGSG